MSPSKPAQLPLAALPAVFGVSAMSIYLWRLGTPTKDALTVPFTPARLRAWAKKNGRAIAKDPEVVLAKFRAAVVKKVGRPVANGKKAKVRPERAGSLGKWAAKKNSERAARARA